jgi:hypothetical protein
MCLVVVLVFSTDPIVVLAGNSSGPVFSGESSPIATLRKQHLWNCQKARANKNENHPIVSATCFCPINL